MKTPQTFSEILRMAVEDMAAYGFDDIARLHEWIRLLRFAATGSLPNDDQLETQIRSAMHLAFTRAVSKTALARTQPGLTRFDVERIKPELRNELDRRILASVNLIKLNRDQAIEKTLQRFSGWASSLPAGGSRIVDKLETRQDIGKPIRGATFEVRRVQIDQGHKLIAAVNDVLARQTGAIAAVWRSHGRHDKNYDARPEHLARDGKVYAIRGGCALERGLMNKGEGYTDEQTQPGEEPFCRCWYRYEHNLRELPDAMLTARGRFALQETKAA